MANRPELVIEEFVAAVNSGDIERVLSFYERDARLAFPGQPSVGHDAIRKTLQGLISQKPTMKGKTLSVSTVRELAVLRSQWSLAGTDPTGGHVEMAGESAELVRRQADGSWLYVVDLPMGKE
jgi:uncharacterized protein (TIGR02246 family)